ncbi:hypothetical protein BDP27DRAFT_249942 [Rhodocollybia butyracea]|uniref:Uncharacterized protein n=1 Tax=Rhodocollybia butyracea TaxID=206335 RepID=A0A9P5U1U2_9AGAR|nr:hypothetical protein BDP27DRAFT_249942 [Rhodocollybia butyracea]
MSHQVVEHTASWLWVHAASFIPMPHAFVLIRLMCAILPSGLLTMLLRAQCLGREHIVWEDNAYAIEIEALDVVYSISTYVRRTVSISTYSQIFMHNKEGTNVYRSRESGCICTRSHVLISTSSPWLENQKQNMNVFPCKSVCIQLI